MLPASRSRSLQRPPHGLGTRCRGDPFPRGSPAFPQGRGTNRLKKVTVDPGDVAAITAGMSKCSNYTGHDGGQKANVALPSPDEVEIDINALEDWQKSVVARREKKRQKLYHFWNL